MSNLPNWENLKEEQQNKFQNDKSKYVEYVKNAILKEQQSKSSQKPGSGESLNQLSSQGQNNEKPLTLEEKNLLEAQKFKQTGISNIYLKGNQRVFDIAINVLHLGEDDDKDEDFNRFLSEKNQFKKAQDFAKTDDDVLVKKVFETIFADKDARICLKYLCAFSLGGKFKQDRKEMNKKIQECLIKNKLFPYGGANKCGYNGLLKLAPKFLSDIRKSTLKEKKHPRDNMIDLEINYYAPGFESTFDYAALLTIGCNQASINYCATKLLLSIDLIDKKRYKNDNDINLMKGLAALTLPYQMSDYIVLKPGNKKILDMIKTLDLKGSSVNFDAFGYKTV